MRRVAIVAKGGTGVNAPYRDPSWEIWGMPWIRYPKVDLLFECHEKQMVNDATGFEKFDAGWRALAFPLYDGVKMLCPPCRLQDFPHATEYPLKAVLSSLPIPYLENSVAYMLAYAIYQQVDEIGLWGVHMWGTREMEWERPSVVYLIGLAQGRGIKVTNAPGSPLFMSRWESGRYGISGGERRFLAAMGFTAGNDYLDAKKARQ